MERLVYISGPLSDLSEEDRNVLRGFYENIGKVCRDLGLIPYIPHMYGDPVRFAHLTPAQIDEIDRTAVTQSFLVIAYVGIPSTGVGIEIEMAYHANKPVILVFERTKYESRRVSRLVRGNKSVVHEVIFDEHSEALVEIDHAINRYLSLHDATVLPEPLKHQPSVKVS